MPRLVVIIPTYNEAANLPALISELFTLRLESLEILVVDDASPDGTGQLAEELSRQYPGRMHFIHRAGKLGLGTAYIEGFGWAIEHGADIIIQMDADFSHSPNYLPQMLSLIESYDVVVGSRYVPGGMLDQKWGLGRWFLSWWANSVWVRLSLGLKTRDATAGFKCWRAGALQQIGLDSVRSNGYIFQVEMCYLAEKMGLRIKEFPIYFEDRQVGHSKMSIPVKLEAAYGVFAIRRRHHHRKPGDWAQANSSDSPGKGRTSS